MKQSKRILLILPIFGWSFVSLLCLALDRAQSPDGSSSQAPFSTLTPWLPCLE